MDGSAQSLAAAEWAAREAALRERALHPVHAWNRQPRSSEGEGEHAVQRYPCRRVLRQAEDRIRAGYPTVRLTCEQAEGPATPVSRGFWSGPSPWAWSRGPPAPFVLVRGRGTGPVRASAPGGGRRLVRPSPATGTWCGVSTPTIRATR
ncbi:universal stress protein [Streptomyces caniscabiei]|uniref:Universal stress protein n=1 Tax=Streptomyces caniscabiei TaxID=2746961 RepID=A0ABU4N1K5_9ACTN|nr:universal stress protein [Streptomyces caniscabiei]MDX2940524.1 universal stress protein [Streptomyces caniscabiei]MDX2954070.1 universal stress protein [Streptomyces caniscabiei]MDX2982841.1 universal stress protein [Streptomyces caniscabiei]MDX3013865.1 universal stress protein [Streptomyces caniscabiei]MDX3043666.1 universal stress protein [Streptomyces caniscabiei]